MENYIQSLRNYIADHPPDYGDGNAKSILEMLFCHYTEFNRFDTDAIKLGFDELYARMEQLHLRDIDKIIDIVCFLCQAHEKAGFTEGVKVGMRLAEELA
jgi:hypothetical protein